MQSDPAALRELAACAERQAIVAWLRKGCIFLPENNYKPWQAHLALADAIERGDHLTAASLRALAEGEGR